MREFVELLNSNEVEYVVVGALAVAWHGYVRYLADLDILIRPGESNIQRVLALNQFGFGSLGFGKGDLASAGTVIQLGVQPNRIDLLTSITGMSFEDIWVGRTPGNLDGAPVQFIGCDELSRNKRVVGQFQIDPLPINELLDALRTWGMLKSCGSVEASTIHLLTKG